MRKKKQPFDQTLFFAFFVLAGLCIPALAQLPKEPSLEQVRAEKFIVQTLAGKKIELNKLIGEGKPVVLGSSAAALAYLINGLIAGIGVGTVFAHGSTLNSLRNNAFPGITMKVRDVHAVAQPLRG